MSASFEAESQILISGYMRVSLSVVKLTKNWRNHSAILRYPNERFYANELEACAPASTTDSLLSWSELGRAGFPIIFENIAGTVISLPIQV